MDRIFHLELRIVLLVILTWLILTRGWSILLTLIEVLVLRMVGRLRLRLRQPVLFLSSEHLEMLLTGLLLSLISSQFFFYLLAFLLQLEFPIILTQTRFFLCAPENL